MKTIYLLRHAKSSWKDAKLDDFDRPLNKRGRRAAALMGQYLVTSGIEPAQILCSSAERTRETLGYLQEAIGTSIPTRFEKGIYEAEAADLLNRLRGLSEVLPSVMVIGHNPGMERLALMLAADGGTGPTRMADKFPTGALAVLSADIDAWEQLAPEIARLDAFVCPRDLEAGED